MGVGSGSAVALSYADAAIVRGSRTKPCAPMPKGDEGKRLQ